MIHQIKFRDYLAIPTDSVPDQLLRTWDKYEAMVDKVLRMKIDATHSGRVTNKRVYPGKKMKKAAPTWTSVENGGSSNFDKPVLINHDIDSDPIGRVIGAEFVHLKRGQDFDNDFRLPELNGPGSGFIRLSVNIADIEAAAKFLDKRYQTVSTSQSTKEFKCSICDKEMIPQILRLFGLSEDDDACDHIPGKVYPVKNEDTKKTEKRLCFGITGDLEYHEVSPVNVPADSFAKVSEISSSDSLDLEYKPEIDINKFEYKSVEGAANIHSFRVLDAEGHILPESDKTVHYMPTKAIANIADVDDEDEKDSRLQELLDKVLDETITEDEEDELYDEYLAPEVGDAKLSTKQRKSLKSSSFCGPGRSFPVNDCCVSKGTLIRSLNGESIPIEDVQSRLDNGEIIWVYGFDLKTRTIIPAKVSKAWLAVKNQPILKIVLDNGKSIKCTANHPFLLRNMSYKRADELSVGDSLMPLYTKITANRNQEDAIYEKVYQPWYGYWEYTHHMSIREYTKRPKLDNEVVHHVDHSKLNNVPTNLEYMDKIDHVRHHGCFRTNNTVLSEGRYLRNKQNVNHKIISIENLPNEDAYDIEVPATNNFALAAGVFVHNSHYTAALRLIGRYKGSGDKSRIRACIMRKGKQLGCPGAGKKDNSFDSLLENLVDAEVYFNEETGEIIIKKNTPVVAQEKSERPVSDKTDSDKQINSVSEPRAGAPEIKAASDKSGQSNANSKDRGSAKMEDKVKVDTTELSAADLKSLIQSLTEHRDMLIKQVKELETKVSKLETDTKDRETQISKLNDELEKQDADSKKMLSSALVATSVILKRKTVKSVSDRKGFDEAVNSFAQRSLESLSDSLADAVLEVTERLYSEDKIEDTSKTTSAKDVLKDTKTDQRTTITDPVSDTHGTDGIERVMAKYNIK